MSHSRNTLTIEIPKNDNQPIIHQPITTKNSSLKSIISNHCLNNNYNDNKKRCLFCFDFDQTIVKGHFHNLLVHAIQIHKQHNIKINLTETIDKLLDNPKYTLKHPHKMYTIIKKALDKGHYVAITSFTSFPEVFEPTLRRLGLTNSEIGRIGKYYGFPSKRSTYKCEHIESAMRDTNIQDRTLVYLIDDDNLNCDKAIEEGYHAIVVPCEDSSSDEYLNCLLDVLS